MYFNHRGERVSRARWREMYQAFQNRQELIKAGLTSRRDLMKLGLLTAAGTLIPKRGLSWGNNNCSYGSTGCGNCGVHARTCQANCQWGGFGSCDGQGVCAPGQTDSKPCGDCGTNLWPRAGIEQRRGHQRVRRRT